MSVPVISDVAGLRAQVAGWRSHGEDVALVPTMGALHDGHLALVRRARAEARRTVVSIFVNPTQFAPTEDFGTYPRTLEADRAMLAEADVDLVYAPNARAIYPEGFATTVTVGGPALAGLEDATRPHFFAGVATVVAKLLTRCAPDVALFGEKDYQQLQVVTRLVHDLDLPVRIVGVATVREPDGLAMSSRNRNLSADERLRAAALPEVLGVTAAALRRGEASGSVLARGRSLLATAGFAVDYLELRHCGSLASLDRLGEAPARLLAAVRLGAIRLIDNLPV